MGRLARFIRFYTDEDDGNGGEKGVLKTVSGALLHIADALAKPAKKFTATLEPIQDLHGQDSPYPAGGGKNKLGLSGRTVYSDSNFSPTSTVDLSVPLLFEGFAGPGYYVSENKPNNIVYGSNNSFSFTVKTAWYGIGFNIPVLPETQYVLSKKSLTSGAAHQVAFYTDESKFISNTIVQSNGLFTTPTNAVYAIVAIMSGTVGIEVDVEELQLELGSTATAYAPYSNICPITGWTGAKIPKTGKNLAGFWKTGYVDADGNITGESTNNALIYPIPIKTDDSFTFSNNAGFSVGFAVFRNRDLTDLLIRRGSSVTTYRSTFDGFMVAWFNCGTTTPSQSVLDTNKCQVEKWSNATEYEPYGEIYELDFPDAAGTVYGGTLTHEDGEWKLTVDRMKFIFPTGDIPFSNLSVGTNTTRVYLSGESYVFTYKMKPNSSTQTRIMCNNLKCYPPDYIYTNDVEGISENRGGTNGLWIRISNDRLNETTIAGVKSWLINNNVDVVYVITTPITYTLTESQALTLLKDTNNVWCDASDDLELQYYAKAEETP